MLPNPSAFLVHLQLHYEFGVVTSAGVLLVSCARLRLNTPDLPPTRNWRLYLVWVTAQLKLVLGLCLANFYVWPVLLAHCLKQGKGFDNALFPLIPLSSQKCEMSQQLADELV